VDLSIVARRFSLANRDWRVLWVSSAEIEEKAGGAEALGLCDADAAIIYLNTDLLQMDLEVVLHTFEHELTHAILAAHGINPGEHDERFVEGFSALRRQFERTRSHVQT
jgi:hypothetical protein